MSYYLCVEDVGEEVANALNQFLGETLPDTEETSYPKPDVVAGLRPVMVSFHPTLDAEVIGQISEIVRHIDMGSDEDPAPTRGKGLKRARADFASFTQNREFRGESVYRWFFAHSEKLTGVADDAAMRAGYAAYWRSEFERLIKLIEMVAMERDNNDDQFYEWEAAMGSEDDA
jgi:hypothetical protein